MQTIITVNVTPEGRLELPPEISQIFCDGEQYSVIVNTDTISFQKVSQLTWDQLRKKREQIESEIEDITTEEICEIVREVRQEMKK